MKRSVPLPVWVIAASFLLYLTQSVLSMVLNNTTHLESILNKYKGKDEDWWRARSRGKRAISEGDMHLILDLHNKLRGQVHPPASNMEYMVSTAIQSAVVGQNQLFHCLPGSKVCVTLFSLKFATLKCNQYLPNTVAIPYPKAFSLQVRVSGLVSGSFCPPAEG